MSCRRIRIGPLARVERIDPTAWRRGGGALQPASAAGAGAVVAGKPDVPPPLGGGGGGGRRQHTPCRAPIPRPPGGARQLVPGA
eukprot:1184066-Prorocentrum_minimum.AAC.1